MDCFGRKCVHVQDKWSFALWPDETVQLMRCSVALNSQVEKNTSLCNLRKSFQKILTQSIHSKLCLIVCQKNIQKQSELLLASTYIGMRQQTWDRFASLN